MGDPTIDFASTPGDVEWYRYTPGDGYIYDVCLTPLPPEGWPELGGHDETHVLVTLFAAHRMEGAASYVLARDGYLHESYVAEKFDLPDVGPVRKGAVEAIRKALGREDV